MVSSSQKRIDVQCSTKVRKSEFVYPKFRINLAFKAMKLTLEELLAARIRVCIEAAGFKTVESFAFEFGIGKSTLSDILTGKKSPTVSTLARWANALGIPLREFFEDKRLDEWVREAPPEYFQNRAKTPRGGKAGPATRKPRTPKSLGKTPSKRG